MKSTRFAKNDLLRIGWGNLWHPRPTRSIPRAAQEASGTCGARAFGQLVYSVSMRLALAAFSLTIMLGARTVEAGQGIQSYGWFDTGGMIGVPARGSTNQFGAGFGFSSGVQFLSYLQAGGRLRLIITSQEICGRRPSGVSCSTDWGGVMGSLGAELRLRFPVSLRLAVAIGASLSVGAWSGCVGNDGCGDGGENLAADFRVVYLIGRRVGVHVAFEQQEQYGIDNGKDRFALSTFWAGLNW
jgi:hypothetical protein